MQLTVDVNGGIQYIHYTDPLQRNMTLVKESGKLSRIVCSLFNNPFVPEKSSMRIAVFGDMHGHLTLGLKKLKEWIDFSGQNVSAILQAGDLGALDYTSCIDKITKEMAEKDFDELGFRNYYYGSEEADQFFGDNGFFKNVPFYFINGNHDDISFLNAHFNQKGSSAKYAELNYLADGESAVVSAGNLSAVIVALGWNSSKTDAKNLANSAKNIDVLLTHSFPRTSDSNHNLTHISEFIALHTHQYHFFSHHRDAVLLSDMEFRSYGVNEVKSNQNGTISPGAVGIIEITRDRRYNFTYVPEEDLSKI
jgi:predicted phosphodiesterase